MKLSVSRISRGLNKAPLKFRDVMVIEEERRTGDAPRSNGGGRGGRTEEQDGVQGTEQKK